MCVSGRRPVLQGSRFLRWYWISPPLATRPFSVHGVNALLLPGANLPYGPALHILATSGTCSRKSGELGPFFHKNPLYVSKIPNHIVQVKKRQKLILPPPPQKQQLSSGFFFFFFFFFPILWCCLSGDLAKSDLATFCYKPTMKIQFF
jgi:hypothetical protein